jgi:hypothetical protein
VSEPLHVEVRVRGRLAGDLLALVDDLGPRVVPRHTVLTVGSDGADEGGDEGPDAGGLTRLLTALDRAGVELDRVLPLGRADAVTPVAGAADG